MNDAMLKSAGQVAAAALILPVLGAWFWGPRVGFGVFAGGIWNLANFWCLTRLLSAWLGPQQSRRRVIGWLLVKCPLLYGAAFALLSHPAVSVIGFSIGFTVVLVSVMIFVALRIRQIAIPRA